MAATKSARKNEGLKDKRRRERQNQILRHACQSARAIRKRDGPPSSLALTPESLKSLSSIRVDSNIPRYKVCEMCRVSKAIDQYLSSIVNYEYSSWCVYCLLDENGSVDEKRWCYANSHEALCSEFINNGQTYSRCSRC